MKRCCVELLLSGASALAALTLTLPPWIERLLGLEFDGGSGALEWALTGGLLLASLGLSMLARRDWVRHRCLRQAEAMTRSH